MVCVGYLVPVGTLLAYAVYYILSRVSDFGYSLFLWPKLVKVKQTKTTISVWSAALLLLNQHTCRLLSSSVCTTATFRPHLPTMSHLTERACDAMLYPIWNNTTSPFFLRLTYIWQWRNMVTLITPLNRSVVSSVLYWCHNNSCSQNSLSDFKQKPSLAAPAVQK